MEPDPGTGQRRRWLLLVLRCDPRSRRTKMEVKTNRISQIQLVMIPSTDQDRSVAFYEALGFDGATTSRGATATAGSRSTRRPGPRVSPLSAAARGPDGHPDRHHPEHRRHRRHPCGLAVKRASTSTPRWRGSARRPRFGSVRLSWPVRVRRCSGSATPTATPCCSSRRAEDDRAEPEPVRAMSLCTRALEPEEGRSDEVPADDLRR